MLILTFFVVVPLQLEHPHLSELQRDNFIWNLSNIPLLEAFFSLLDGDSLKDVAESVIHQYKTTVIPKRSRFRKCEYNFYLALLLECLLCALGPAIAKATYTS